MKELKSEDAVSYAMAFVSFVFPKLEGINEVILFGSAARGEADKESDIDLFFDVARKDDEEKIRNLLKEESGKFYKSKIFEMWQLKGIRNSFSINVGVLGEWKLKRSIISDGIIIYSKYKESPKDMKAYVYFGLEPIKNIARRNKIIRKLFGRKEGNKITKGEIEQVNGKRLSPSSFVVGKQMAGKIISILDTEKAKYRFFELWTDQLIS
jgi:predicted nucleotidyltransferase